MKIKLNETFYILKMNFYKDSFIKSIFFAYVFVSSINRYWTGEKKF